MLNYINQTHSLYFLREQYELDDDLPAGDILWCVAVECEVVEDCAFRAAWDAGVLALHADVEATAVIGLDVASVVEDVAVGVDLRGIRTREPIFEDLCADMRTIDSNVGHRPSD